MNEEKRLENLYQYDILDTPPDGTFDNITRLASQLLKTPISIISLVDSDRIWFKSAHGLEGVNEIERAPGLCASAILEEDFYLVEDAKNDIRTLANPLVASSFGLQYYAAAPLNTKEGFNLGTLCVIDKKPRKITEEEKEILKNLSEIVINQMDLRLEARKAIKKQVDLTHMLVHDLRSPFTSMNMFADLISKEFPDNQNFQNICNMMKDTANKSCSMLDGFLEDILNNASNFKLKFSSFNIYKETSRIILHQKHIASLKNIDIKFIGEEEIVIEADLTKYIEIIDNLVSNAIKYSEKGKNIFIELDSNKDFAIIKIKDEGQGFSEEDKQNAFKKFAVLSSKPTAGEKSNGLGLWIVKLLVEAHKGKIELHSEGKNKGSEFIISLPLKQ